MAATRAKWSGNSPISAASRLFNYPVESLCASKKLLFLFCARVYSRYSCSASRWTRLKLRVNLRSDWCRRYANVWTRKTTSSASADHPLFSFCLSPKLVRALYFATNFPRMNNIRVYVTIAFLCSYLHFHVNKISLHLDQARSFRSHRNARMRRQRLP